MTNSISILTFLLEILAVFFAFLAVALSLRIIEFTRGGLFAQAIRFLIIGIFCLILGFLLYFAGGSVGKVSILEPNLFLVVITVLMFLGFGFLCISLWIFFKELS